MVWCGIHGHDRILERFRRSLQRGRLASSFLFVGPSGIGKRAFAVRLAQGLLCDARSAVELDPCLSCVTCQQIAAGNHPDVDSVARPAGRSFIPLELFIGDREHRSREGLCHRLALKPASGKRRVAIIEDADFLNPEGANCLLKTLEEPPPGSVLILVGTSQQRQLPTIRSRCQIICFERLPDEFVQGYLTENDLVSGEDAAQEVAALAEGSLERAIEYADQELTGVREELWDRLGQDDIDSQSLAKWVGQFVDAAGRDAPSRRNRLRQVIRLCLLLYRQRLLASAGVSPSAPHSLQRPKTLRHDTLAENCLDDADRLQRCLDALGQVDANANLPTLIECWIDDMVPVAGTTRPGRPARDPDRGP